MLTATRIGILGKFRLRAGSALSSVDLKYIVLAMKAVVRQRASVLATEQELCEKVKFECKSVEGDKRGRADVGEQKCFYPTM